MKANKFFYAIIAVITLISVSCVEDTAKYKALVAQRDSLAMEKEMLTSNYNETLVILNDIETGFSEINKNEKEIQVNLKGVEGKTTNKREIIAAQMTAIKENIEQNKAKIEELKKLEAKAGRTNSKLSETIKRLQMQLDEKTTQIESLQAELEQKNIKISELTSTVDLQSKNIAEQQNVMEQQKSTIEGQDTNLNTVWYCIATSSELKTAKILTNTGLFQSKKILAADFDKSVFTKVDLRKLSSLPTNSKTAKILSAHPQGSYALVKGSDNKITIEISDPTKFWSVSKYLVVQK